MKGQWSKLFVVTAAFLLFAGACAAPPEPPTPTPMPPTATPIPPTPASVDVVQNYQDALDRHDVDAAMAMFTDDTKYAWGSYFTTTDKTMIRNWHEYVAGLNSQTKANDCKPNGPTVTCEWRFVHDCFGAEGAIGAGYDMGGTVVFTVKDGKISEYVFTESSDPEYDQWGEAFFKWLDDSHPMDIVPVVQALRTWKFDRDFGQRLVKFCKEQAGSLKSATTTTTDNKGASGAALGDLRLTILYDNTAVDTQLKSDWGFAALVEYGDHMLLFDTGADGAMLLDNMRQLDVDPQSIEAIVLSHEHYDHTGGLQALLDAGYRPSVYVPSKFGDLSKEYVRKQTQLIEVTDAVEIFPGVRTTRPVGSTVEQALVLESREGAVVITGCAHPGLVEMVRQAKQVVPGKISLLVGGFHSPMVDDSMIAELRQLGVERVLPAHCTGDSAIAKFRTEYGGNYIDGGVGRTVTASTVSRATLPASTPLPTTVSSEGADDLSTVVQAYYAALNSGDVDATLALFTDDVKFRGENYATGKEMLRGVFDWLAGTEVKHGPPDCQSQNDRVLCAFSIGDACIAASGATDGLPAQGEYLIQPDGKIREASESLGGAGWDDYIQWDNSFQGWAMLNRTEEWRGFGKSKEFAPRLIKLCKEYGASLKSAPTSTPIPSTPAPSSDLEKLAMSFADAFNRRDVDAALALFVDDGLNYMWDGWKTNNKEDVRSGLEYMIGRGANLTFADCAPKGKALGCTLEWRDDYCQKAWTGLDVARHDLTLSAQGNKIKLFSAMRTAEVDKAYYESYLKLIDWAEANRPDDWKKVKAPVAYDLSGQPLGELESSLCKAYLEATKK